MTEETKQRLAFISGINVGSRVSTKKYGDGTVSRRSLFYKDRQWLIKYDCGALEWADIKTMGMEGEYKPEEKKNAETTDEIAG